MVKPLELTMTDLKTGISWWLSRGRWPNDFHNAVYYELYDSRKNGLSDNWWDRTADRLVKWQATRPYTKAQIKRQGLPCLSDLQRMYSEICAQTDNEPLFLNFQWDQVKAFFEALANIKGSRSPVFPSKLGHFIFPKLFIVMDQMATGTNDYEILWQSMHEAWASFDERDKAKRILSEEIAAHSGITVHRNYPFEIKIIELNLIGRKQTGHTKSIPTAHTNSSQLATSKRREVPMNTFNDSYSCQHCRFSVKKLKQMAEIGGNKEMFETWGKRKRINIYEVNTDRGHLVMRRSTGELTRQLRIDALIRIHNSVHSGEIGLDPHEIDYLELDGKRETFKWGNYTASLLRHLECKMMA